MIKNFQKKYGLVPDGIVGKNTALKIAEVFNIGSVYKLANFMGQTEHESGGFTARRENLNYSTTSLKQTFDYYKKRPQEAEQDGRNSKHVADQQTIANKVYWDKNRGERYKLGNPNWGDGWKNRGVGAIQTTGGYNIAKLDRCLQTDGEIIENPDLIWQHYYIESAICFFDDNKIWGIANTVGMDTTKKITKIIQGGNLHVKERHEKVIKWLNILKPHYK